MIIVVAAIGALSLIGSLVLIAKSLRRVEPGTALLVSQPGRPEPRVFLSGTPMVLPIVNHADVIDLSVKRIVLECRGGEGLSCADGIRADVTATFLLRINPTSEDVLKVAQTVGCARASDQTTLEELFTAKFSEGLKVVARQLDFEPLTRERDHFKDQVIAYIGKDLNGYVLDDVAVDRLEQTPIDQLDPGNVLDAQGIKKIKSLTASN
ncbi:MAG TPA: SPFH domain-containing protein [Kofleriaceae bacterium]|nr:SPFH domain-containing protein [Kofleriaceae bacterium]